MRILYESPSGACVIAEILGKEISLSQYAYNQILNKIWPIVLENNELIIYDENNDEIDRF